MTATVDSPGMTSKARPRIRLSWTALFLVLVLTGAAAWTTHEVVDRQESALLGQRTNEVGLVLESSVSAIKPSLTTIAAVVNSSAGSPTVFAKATAPEVTADNGKVAFAVLHPDGPDYVVALVAGRGLYEGEVVTGIPARTAQEATRSATLTSTGVLGTGAGRTLGFAVSLDPAVRSVLYERLLIGPARAPDKAISAPFRQMRVVVYASPSSRPTQVIVSTTPQLPLRGDVQHRLIAVGASRWSYDVNAISPLIGSVAADAEWFVLGIGLVVALLVGLAISGEASRRKVALALYASEHQLAETLQRSLLPALPRLPGIELDARYLAGGAGQRIGGDWFDAFPIAGGRIGVVIGDVVGHDMAAAAAMSQIRSALRAYGWQGTTPAAVLERLDQFMETFHLADLVTIFYGVLSEPGTDGGRSLRYANAGHPSPLVKMPDGTVHELAGGRSVVVGAPVPAARTQAAEDLPPGASLLLFTDGLVEIPGESLDDGIAALTGAVAAIGRIPTVDRLCAHVIASMPRRDHDDDVAILAIRLLPPAEPRRGRRLRGQHDHVAPPPTGDRAHGPRDGLDSAGEGLGGAGKDVQETT